MSGSRDHRNETSGSIALGYFLEQLSAYRLFKTDYSSLSNLLVYRTLNVVGR
jgi:hypothetical protein